MSATRGFIGMTLMMVLVLGLAALTLLAQVDTASVVWQSQPVAQLAAQEAVPNWLAGRQTAIEPGLSISPHATKHAAEQLDAERIYAMLLQGQCAAADQFCNSDGMRLYLCFDFVTGLLGGLFIQDGMVISGYGSRASYWAGKVRGDSAPFKVDRCYQH